MKELNRSQFHKAIGIFSGIAHNVPLVYGVLEQSVEGRVFVDNDMDPAVVLVMFFDIFFIGGDPDNNICNETLYELLYHDIIPNSQYEWFDLYTFSEEWATKLEQLLGKKIADKRYRRNFRISKDQKRNKSWRESVPDGFVLREVDAALVSELNLDKGFWAHESKRFGFILLKDKQIVSECIAVFVGNGQCEISVETNSEHRRKGYAYLTSSAFIDYALSRGINPNWACWEDRESSTLLAKKLGYEEVEKCRVLIIGK